MRRTKLYQLMAVACGLASMSAWADKPVPEVDVVTPLNWTAGKVTVDGDISDWGDLSGGNIMCTAGSLGVDGCEGNGKEQLSTVYLRYDCTTNTMYVLVLGEGADRSEDDAWVTVGGNSNKVLENFAWVGETDGYEASFTMTEDSDNVQVHLNVDGETSSTGKNGDTSSITGLDSCEMPVDDTPVDDTPVDDTPVDDTPVDDTPADNGGGNPNMLCSEIIASNNASMSLIDKFEWSGSSYTHASGTNAIDISGDATGGSWEVINSGIVDVDAVIIKGATGTYVYNYEPGSKISDVFSKLDLPLNNGGQVPDISNIQFCQDGVLNAGTEVCLWSADKDAEGNYVNIEQVGCVDAEKGKFYAIKAGDEFSSALEVE